MFPNVPADDEGDDEDGGPGIVIERPPLREGKVFLDYGDRAAIADNLESAYVALNHAFRGIWIDKALDHGWPREYWDEGDVDELDSLVFTATEATERAWRTLTQVLDAHATQQQEADERAADDE